MKVLSIFGAAVAAMTFAGAAHAIVGGIPPRNIHFEIEDKRFDAIGAFATTWRLGLDPTHPEAGDHEWFCTATLVDDHTVMLANHCLMPYGLAAPYAVRFRRHKKGTVGTKEKGPKSYHHALVARWIVPSTGDVALGILQSPVYHIAPIPLLPLDAGLNSQPGDPLILGGWGKEGPGLGEGLRNQLLLCDTALSGINPTTVLFPTAWQSGGPGCGVNNNDSGAPVLLESALDGELRVLGVVFTYGAATNLGQYAGLRQFESRALGWSSET